MINIEKEERIPGEGYLKLHKLTLKDKNNKTFNREFINLKNAVCAVVYDEIKHKYLFVKQFRPGSKNEIIEIVAGLIDGGDSPINTMIREIEEEIGYKTDHIVELLPPYYTSPGHSSEMMYTYFATVSKKIAQGGGVEGENENIEIIEMSKAEIQMTNFKDGKTLFALTKLRII